MYEDDKEQGLYERFPERTAKEKGTYEAGKGPLRCTTKRTSRRRRFHTKMANKRRFVWYHENGQLMERGTYEAGNKQGLWLGYSKNGQLSEKFLFKDNKKQGPFETYTNGTLYQKGVYEDDKKQGLYERFHQNGQLWEKGAYEADIEEGVWVEYYANGQL